MNLDGEWYTDKATRILYATDASAYRELPKAVAVPKTVDDLKKLIAYAKANKTSLIPRTAGTSLAGQVVGNGVVVDISKYFTKILELNTEERWVRVQPGVIRDDLNRYLKTFDLFFAPETSTANRAMIGGMVGNNSCGANSVVYGSTREHLISAKAILSDESEAVFESLPFESFIEKCNGDNFESSLYRNIRSILSNYDNQVRIREEFPKQQVSRRNTGYAIDLLLNTNPFTAGTSNFNFCQLLAGSEGTLALFTELKLGLQPLPKGESGLLCIHLDSISDALKANIIALRYKPQVSELIDHYILDCTRENLEQSKNRFFVRGNPKAILAVEYLAEDQKAVLAITDSVEVELRESGLGYHYPVVFGGDRKKVWELRKAGLGLLSNLPGDDKAVAVIEDTAVAVEDLPEYIREFNDLLKKHDLFSVHYAHAGSGELHLRPIINLKTEEGLQLFRKVAAEVAELVKKYRGSLSGEHGDGRLRGEFIPYMIGKENYQLLCNIKKAWDPDNIFNPGKITATPPMDKYLRYTTGAQVPEFKTIFRFQGQNILQHAEQCNGSGDCRKLESAGGTMCPSYMVTRNERDTTRARANVLREILTHSTRVNRFDSEEIREVMDLCISCKGCKSECPSSVDMAKLKAEFLYQYYQNHRIPLRSLLVGNIAAFNKLAQPFATLFNAISSLSLTKKLLGFSTKRSLPALEALSLKKWHRTHPSPKGRIVYLFCDEFINYNEVQVGVKAVQLLEALGYEVRIPEHKESGRAAISKGLLQKAKRLANDNVRLLSTLISEQTPLIGIEPSAILTFRDEYPDLVDEDLLKDAQMISRHALLIDEFLANEMRKGNISKEQFEADSKKIILHGHCQQKAWLATGASKTILSFPENYVVEEIPSGCCGMAGSFGYEAEHYEVSMQIGELVLFPAVRQSDEETIIAATGTSCRHQIKDGTGKIARHPVEILFEALKQS
ncbi:FAD-binding and (Fe-S)-binding domain-containing protein [Desertivirga arenae]|uniref:FAD-binding and (Fe-S)-binding domain-containing protein n=1 Tax=Desertivirga arenae TaxID=2810309 RepID=UPI001A9637C4|nr:FAD-binding and (Fe-S)-binding domain-containing protein [Pedobacter sp. SYSU D00823]